MMRQAASFGHLLAMFGHLWDSQSKISAIPCHVMMTFLYMGTTPYTP
jgi:hypothetical protein